MIDEFEDGCRVSFMGSLMVRPICSNASPSGTTKSACERVARSRATERAHR